jgi:hypothetical protein
MNAGTPIIETALTGLLVRWDENGFPRVPLRRAKVESDDCVRRVQPAQETLLDTVLNSSLLMSAGPPDARPIG